MTKTNELLSCCAETHTHCSFTHTHTHTHTHTGLRVVSVLLYLYQVNDSLVATETDSVPCQTGSVTFAGQAKQT